MDRSVDDAWLEDLYPDLHDLALRMFRGERSDHTLSATAVVHEAFLRLRERRVPWENREQFLGTAAMTMRRVLIDHARTHTSEKRGGSWGRVPLEEFMDSGDSADAPDLLDFDRALDALEEAHERASRVVQLRFFLGLSVEAVARELERSVRSVHDDWAFARAFLRRELNS